MYPLSCRSMTTLKHVTPLNITSHNLIQLIMIIIAIRKGIYLINKLIKTNSDYNTLMIMHTLIEHSYDSTRTTVLISTLQHQRHRTPCLPAQTVSLRILYRLGFGPSRPPGRCMPGTSQPQSGSKIWPCRTYPWLSLSCFCRDTIGIMMA